MRTFRVREPANQTFQIELVNARQQTCRCRVGGTSMHMKGSVVVSGSPVKWLRDSLVLIESASKINPLARKVLSTFEVYLISDRAKVIHDTRARVPETCSDRQR
ncbi:hypothetical protein EI94DRAFT_668337 [Lactarius quietus]|nr:hypothetical protein EI94DRAFT_668337 [Lactarius quietus]